MPVRTAIRAGPIHASVWGYSSGKQTIIKKIRSKNGMANGSPPDTRPFEACFTILSHVMNAAKPRLRADTGERAGDR
jgi:hypothetical protein